MGYCEGELHVEYEDNYDTKSVEVKVKVPNQYAIFSCTCVYHDIHALPKDFMLKVLRDLSARKTAKQILQKYDKELRKFKNKDAPEIEEIVYTVPWKLRW